MKKYPILLISLLAALCFLFVGCGDQKNQNAAPDTNQNPQTQPPVEETESVIPDYTGQTTPVVRINTTKGLAIPDDKTYVRCKVSLESNIAEYCKDDLTAEIRCRGNGSLSVGGNTGKYPYKIKFDKSVNPFDLGEGKAKDWVLLAHVGEHTMLRNYAAKLLGDLMDGIPYSPNARLVNVYLNDEYIGVYELSETVEVQENRVNIDDSRDSRLNGFLVEMDNYDSEEYVWVDGRQFSVKSDINNIEQLDYIETYLERVNDAIYMNDEKKLASLVDMNSLVDMYILQEYAKNIDAGWSSFFLYRDTKGKLFFAPPWDFDLAFGNDDRLDHGSYEDLYVGTGRPGFMQNHEWFIRLYSYDWFRALVSERWKEVSQDLIPQLIKAVRQMGETILPDMQENYERWDFLGKKLHQEPEILASLPSYEAHLTYLIQWMSRRQSFLDTEFA